jgi:CRP-like cAMP-binding protein
MNGMTTKTPILEIPFFAGLSETAKDELRSTSVLLEYASGDVILEPGEIGRFLYAIATGAVFVRPASGQREFEIVLGPGEVFGEMSLLSGTRVSAKVIAEL